MVLEQIILFSNIMQMEWTCVFPLRIMRFHKRIRKSAVLPKYFVAVIQSCSKILYDYTDLFRFISVQDKLRELSHRAELCHQFFYKQTFLHGFSKISTIRLSTSHPETLKNPVQKTPIYLKNGWLNSRSLLCRFILP